MNENSNEMLERQASINRAFGLMYFAIYSIDMESGNYLEVSTLDIFREHIPPTGPNQLLFDMVVEYYVSKGYQDGMREFLDMSTLQKRLAGQNAVSNEFFGTTQGWCRASFVVEKRDWNGNVLRFVYVTQEINAEVKTEQERIAELKKAYASADAANQAKSDFLFRMSHDIRTPLNAIIGFDTLIMRYSDDSARVREYAGKLRGSANLLLSLLNEILDMTKIESGEVAIVKKPFSVDEVIGNLELVIRSQTAQKKQSFRIHRLDEHLRFYLGDPVCICRILFNILGNAVKYTQPGGKIELTVQDEDDGPDRSQLLFSVQDNGIGIPDEFQDQIFEKFRRAPDEAVSGTPGTGLGLSVAKNFADMMGGEITLESAPGRGSTFLVRIPLQYAKSPEKPPSAAKQREPDGETDLSGLSILVVDDNDMNIEIIKGLLELSGARCETACCGPEALRKIREGQASPFDLILMDVRMPTMDGYETTKRLRAMKNRRLAEIPVIALTANVFAEDVENARRAGMNAHLAKPLDMKVLGRTIRELLHRDVGKVSGRAADTDASHRE